MKKISTVEHTSHFFFLVLFGYFVRVNMLCTANDDGLTMRGRIKCWKILTSAVQFVFNTNDKRGTNLNYIKKKTSHINIPASWTKQQTLKFPHVELRLEGQFRCQSGESWVFPPLITLCLRSGLRPVRTYARRDERGQYSEWRSSCTLMTWQIAHLR